MAACASVGRVLPSPSELGAYDVAKVAAPVEEWTSSIFYYTPTAEYLAIILVMSPPANVTVGSLGIFNSSVQSYRCVVAPGN